MQENSVMIDHWSHSSLTSFLRNRLQWKKKYLLKIYDDDTYSPSAIVGQAAHKVVEEYFKGFDLPVAITEGMKIVDKTPDIAIDFGKTGSREKMIKSFTSGIDMLFSEMPDFYKMGTVIGSEKTVVTFFAVDGKEMGLPLKAKIDFIWAPNDTEVEILDWKFTTSYSNDTETNWMYVIQSMFNYYAVTKYLADNGFPHKVARMRFMEIKLTKNSDGSPQMQPYTIEYSNVPHYFSLFQKLYDDCTRSLMGENIFLPNPSDMFDGDNSMTLYMQGIISSDLENIVVEHKEKVEKFVEKNYIASAHTKEENKFITNEEKVRTKLQEFGIACEMQETHTGPSVIMYTLKPSRGIRMSSIEQHDKDIALALKVSSIRLICPIMGTDLVGVEVPNPKREPVYYPAMSTSKGLELPIGVNVFGETVKKDLRDMPHLLVAGTPGSGKSVMLNTIIQALTDQNTSEELQLILIDPKRVEFAKFKTLPHLMSEIITDELKAAISLEWAVSEMDKRYELLEEMGCVDIDEYNEKSTNSLSRIVIIIDEFADLMLRDFESFDVKHPETSVVKIAQKARAVGIHVILATQRPSVDVVSGLVKAQFPTRISFRTSTKVDSKVILDQTGAEELTGKGDLLFLDPAQKDLVRLQGLKVNI